MPNQMPTINLMVSYTSDLDQGLHSSFSLLNLSMERLKCSSKFPCALNHLRKYLLCLYFELNLVFSQNNTSSYAALSHGGIRFLLTQCYHPSQTHIDIYTKMCSFRAHVIQL